jgi:drug/metabolite transporter (DMT)-like permease
MNISPYFLVLFCVFSLAAGQLLFKFVSLKLVEGRVLSQDPSMIFVLASAFLLYALSTIVWIFVLKHLPLSRAYLFMSFGYVLVPLGAFLFYGEVITFRYVLGLAMIISGIIISTGH